jgi:RNA 3'-terminal phosphate cyclase (ATP)
MIEIDGSYGEGGGQILRTAIALSGITREGVRIYNIRVRRPNPGLAPQHLHAIHAAKILTNARVDFLRAGSKELVFIPEKSSGGSFRVDIGTAGSITLLLQCILPICVCSDEITEVKIRGGTDVAWSPPFDFLRWVLIPVLKKMGCDISLSLSKRGYYPKGGGEVLARIQPAKLGKICKVKHEERAIFGISHSSRLPGVAERQARAAEKKLEENGYNSSIRVEEKSYLSTGSGITIWSGCKSGSSLGEKGKRAEKVGGEAASSLLKELSSPAGVDVYLADQLLPFMAIGKGSKITTRELSLHATTNLWVIERFLGSIFKVEKGEIIKISS